MFIDRAKLTVKSGKGGDGAIAFHHEKFVERGGPSGGNGGRGGSIYFVTSKHTSTLINYRHAKKIVASDGQNGMAKKMYGAKGEDIYLELPLGTVVYQEPGHHFIVDMKDENQTFLICKGGRGGRGNACFASSRNRTPRVAENGLPGEEKVLTLELKLIADVGLVGMPSVGKSTFLNVVSSARPEIGDYPFTTLIPSLGVVNLDQDNSFVCADIPGLIKGASIGKGLGLAFLRHIERCKVLLHILDMEREDPLSDFEVIMEELKSYSEHLLSRPMVVCLNKTEDDELMDKAKNIEKVLTERGYKVFIVSLILNENVKPMLYYLSSLVKETKEIPLYENKVETVKVFDATKEIEKEFEIEKTSPHSFRIYGPRIERTYSLINLSTNEGVMKLISILHKVGVDDALKNLGAVDGDTVTLMDFEFEYFE